MILEEIAMHDDDPTDMVHDAVRRRSLFGDGPLGRPVLGTRRVDRGDRPRAPINGYYRRRYRPQDMVVAVAGNLDHAAVVRLVSKAFAAAGLLDGDAAPAAPRRPGARRRPAGGVRVVRRTTEQANLVLGVPGPGPHRRAAVRARRAQRGARRRHVVAGCSRRSARSAAWPTRSTATTRSTPTPACSASTPAACPRKVDEVLAICRDELAKVAADGITAEELERGKGQLRGSLVLGLEDTGSRMSRIGKAELRLRRAAAPSTRSSTGSTR